MSLNPLQWHEAHQPQCIIQRLHSGAHELCAKRFHLLLRFFHDGRRVFVEVAEVRGKVVDVGGQHMWGELAGCLAERARVGVDVAEQFPFALIELVG